MSDPHIRQLPIGDAPRRLATVKQTMVYAKIGRRKLYELLNAGDIAAIKRGALTFIDLDSVDAFHAALPAYPVKKADTK